MNMLIRRQHIDCPARIFHSHASKSTQTSSILYSKVKLSIHLGLIGFLITKGALAIPNSAYSALAQDLAEAVHPVSAEDLFSRADLEVSEARDFLEMRATCPSGQICKESMSSPFCLLAIPQWAVWSDN